MQKLSVTHPEVRELRDAICMAIVMLELQGGRLSASAESFGPPLSKAQCAMISSGIDKAISLIKPTLEAI